MNPGPRNESSIAVTLANAKWIDTLSKKMGKSKKKVLGDILSEYRGQNPAIAELGVA